MFIGFSKRLGGGFRIGSYWHLGSRRSRVAAGGIGSSVVFLGIVGYVVAKYFPGGFLYVLTALSVVGFGILQGLQPTKEEAQAKRDQPMKTLIKEKYDYTKNSAFKQNAELRKKVEANLGRYPAIVSETYYGQNGHLYVRSKIV